MRTSLLSVFFFIFLLSVSPPALSSPWSWNYGASEVADLAEDDWLDATNGTSTPAIVTSSFSNSSAHGHCQQQQSTWLGFVCAAIAIIFFGTNYLPVKEVDTGDGIFFQWIVCMGIWLSGLVIHLIKGAPAFSPLAMVGGALWATGNITVVPIIKMIGLGMGLLVWGMGNLIFGWASARFGILGVSKEPPCSNLLNSLGVAFCILGLLAYFFVQSEGKKADSERTPLLSSGKSRERKEHGEKTPVLSSKFTGGASIQNMGSSAEDDQSWTDKLTPTTQRFLGYSMSLVAGALYGVNFNPVTHLQQEVTHRNETVKHSSTWALDYVFSHFCGILLTSTAFFLIYSIMQHSRPRVYPRAVLPGILSGVMWAIADSSWFIANERLSQAIAYPIITTGPGIIAALIGIFYYKEIRGKKNFAFFSVAFVLTVVGVLCTAFSKMYTV